jgi:hypothetical protein
MSLPDITGRFAVRGLEYASLKMSKRVRRAGAIAAAILCALTAAPAVAQSPFNSPVLRDKPKGGFGAEKTPTPTPTPTATETATASPTPTATAKPRKDRALAETGTDPLRVGLAGLSLLGFGLCIRLRVALADARRPA